MFTGIITAVGRLRQIEKQGDWRLVIETPWACDELALGASIACSGVCLTVTDKKDDWFSADVSAETLDRTAISGWQPGQAINLERALRLGDELGGHIVSGHVDGLATLLDITAEKDSHRLKIQVPAALSRFIAEKGSVALDGVSLTVNEVDRDCFGVNMIAHTWQHTTFGNAQAGQHLHLEIDMLARYVSRLISS